MTTDGKIAHQGTEFRHLLVCLTIIQERSMLPIRGSHFD
jgi:hypothetical protein